MKPEEALRKIRFKEGMQNIIIHAPAAVEKEFIKFGFTTQPDTSEKLSFTLLFLKNKAADDKHASLSLEQLEYDSCFGVAYPNLKSDIKQDNPVDLFHPFGCRPVRLIPRTTMSPSCVSGLRNW